MTKTILTDQTAKRTLTARLAERFRASFAPPPRFTIDEWADRYRYLSSVNSAEPGQWRTDRVPFIRGILRAVTDPEVSVVVLKKAAQVSYTEGVIGNVLGFHVHQQPRSMLVVQPSKEDAEDWSKDKLQNLIEATPVLQALLSDTGARGGNNTILSKSFPGGLLKVVGGTSPKGLRRTSAPIVIVDEADGLPQSAGKEGRPIDIVLKRLTTFWYGKAIIGSTPTNEGESVVSELFESTDQRLYQVPCPHCGHLQMLRWGGKDDGFGIKFEYREAGRRRLVVPGSVFYLCEQCAATIEERHKYAMSAAGVWVPQHADTATPGWAGFHLNALVSPFDRVRWPLLVQEWLDAQKHHDKLKVFVNTRLGEAWRMPGTSVTASELEARAEDWRSPDGERVEVPHGVGLLTAFVDVQHDRLEVLVKGWGAEEESWNLAHHRLHGDPSVANGPVWQQLEAIRTRLWRHASGARMRISATGIDSGYCRNEVYAYVAPRQAQATFATKGGKTEQTEPVKHSRTKNAAGVKLVLIGTVPMKDTMFPRLRKKTIGEPGPMQRYPVGYIHFRNADDEWHNGMDSEYFAQFERERVEWEGTAGGGRRRIYKNPSGRANEAIDLEVGNLAMLYLLGPNARENLGAWAEQASRWKPPAQVAGGAGAAGRGKRRVRSRGVAAA